MKPASPVGVTSPTSPGIVESRIKIRLPRGLAHIRRVAGITMAWLYLWMIPIAVAAGDVHDVETIAMKKWEDIANDEMVYVFGQFFGEERLLKFKPGFCVVRVYYTNESAIKDDIERNIARFETESRLREYDYSITVSPDDCKDAVLVLGIYDNSEHENRFYRELEEWGPPLARSRSWIAFKKLPFCGSLVEWPIDTPETISLGVGRVDLREQVYHERFKTCVDDALRGALGGVGNYRRHFLLMGFPRDIVWRLSTTLIMVLYHPDMPYGTFRLSEREAIFSEILDKVRPANEVVVGIWPRPAAGEWGGV